MKLKQLAVSLTAAAVMGAFGSAFAESTTDNNVNVSPNSSTSPSDSSSMGNASAGGSAPSTSLPSADCTCPDATSVQRQIGGTAGSTSGSTSGGDSANAPDASCSCPGANSASGSGAAAGAGEDVESRPAQDNGSTQSR